MKEIQNENSGGLLNGSFHYFNQFFDGIYRTLINSDGNKSETCSILLASLGQKIEDVGEYDIC